MPSAAARRLYEDQIPSFMSILDPEAEGYDESGRGMVTMVDSKMMDMEPTCAPQIPTQLQQQQQHLRPLADHLHRHNESTSTHNSESADSSPTTTLTTDTSSLSDPSPSSSPDSPVNLIPLNSFPATTFGGLSGLSSDLSSNMHTLTVNNGGASELPRPMTSPSPRRARNMKGLSIQPPFQTSLSSSLVSEPSSPSFIKPAIPAMKRKPSQLSLKTDSQGLNVGASIRPTLLDVPSSPALPMLQRRALKHSTSSPHMLSGMKSATFGPAGGMTFPTVLERGESGLSELLRPSTKHSIIKPTFDDPIMEEDSSSPIRSQVANRMEMEPFRDESEGNEDQKSPGYPDGPIAIYEDNVYLYLEPTADEAAKFDVVINVAREVTNPFSESFSAKSAKEEEPAAESPIPDTAVSTASFATAFEYPMEDRVETPTTPKALDISKEPEYIHMPWDHHTDIATDLMTLCEMIEKRTKEGKKVLVHCQQGASRSASLIIAYGLYQNPGMSVNDAYYAAQSKSRWISPNMRLMYCLQDFQKEIAKKRLPRSAAGLKSGRSPTKHRLTLSADAIDITPKEPLSAPLPDESQESGRTKSPEKSPVNARPKSTPNLEALSPGPSSAPSSFSWAEKEDEKDLGKFGRFNLDLDHEKGLQPPMLLEPEPDSSFPPRNSSFFQPPPSPGFPPSHNGFRPPPSPGFPLLVTNTSLRLHLAFPLLEPLSLNRQAEAPVYEDTHITRALPDEDALLSPRAETMTSNPLHDSLGEIAGMKFVEVPPTPKEPNDGFFSPRTTMFPRDPFDPFVRPTQVADPRSPPTKGETPIVRSIDEVL
ncbi:Tyrosine-protein phosphatase pmp1 [Apiospora kogelbergensis]|uniref:Tyrosine-protein phosphatase pmp1 n=1 Tax=Apiospora kogelbergensis TaxID=1337665 RepID=UPI00312D53D6